MATLNLFPARVQFVDSDGRLTPESYRALNALYSRVGGSFGDQGVDSFAEVVASTSDGQFMTGESISHPADVDYMAPQGMQSIEPCYMAPQDMQPIETGYMAEMLMQGEG